MEFIPGLDLGALLKERGSPFEVEQVLLWADQLLDALDYLHTQAPSVIHRDIKPQNLKPGPRGQMILLDFGLAKGLMRLQAQSTTGNSLMGYTPQYAPLEQIEGGTVETRSDLFSLIDLADQIRDSHDSRGIECGNSGRQNEQLSAPRLSAAQTPAGPRSGRRASPLLWAGGGWPSVRGPGGAGQRRAVESEG